MTPAAKALYNSLKKHRDQVVKDYPPKDGYYKIKGENQATKYGITYGELCRNAGVEFLLMNVGHYLNQVALFCNEKQWPPINALAVNAETHMPGGGFDHAGNDTCHAHEWPKHVQDCLNFDGYTDHLVIS